MTKIVVVGIVVLGLATAIALIFDLPPEIGLAATIVAFETARRVICRHDDTDSIKK